MKLTNVKINVDALLAEIPNARLVEELNKRNCHFVESKEPELDPQEVFEESWRDDKKFLSFTHQGIEILKDHAPIEERMKFVWVVVDYRINSKFQLSANEVYDLDYEFKNRSFVTSEQKQKWKDLLTSVVKHCKDTYEGIDTECVKERFFEIVRDGYMWER